MKSLSSRSSFFLVLGLAGAIVAITTRATSQIGQPKATVALQSTSPGTSQSGNVNISGTAIAGRVQAGGVGLRTSVGPPPGGTGFTYDAGTSNLDFWVNVAVAISVSSQLGLTVNGPVSAAGLGLTTSTGAPPGGIGLTNTAGSACTWAGNVIRECITPAGDVGIGTTVPTAKLHVEGGAKVAGIGLTTSPGPPPGGTGFTYDASTNTTFNWVNGGIAGSTLGNFSMRVNGPVFIGTTTGSGALNVNGNVILQGTGSLFANDATIAATGGAGRLFGSINNGWGAMTGRTATGANWYFLGPVGGVTNGGVGVLNNAGTTLIGGLIRDTATNQSQLFANIKPFVEPNPNDPETDIWYNAIEGPEAAMYVRGTGTLVNGRGAIDLPDHFVALADEDGMTVQLTPMSLKSKGLAVANQSLGGIEVGELMEGRGSYRFHWEVKAVRSKHRDFKVVRPWDTTVIAGVNMEDAWTARLKENPEYKNRIAKK